MGLQLHETVYGKNFFEYQLPKLTEAIVACGFTEPPKSGSVRQADHGTGGNGR